MSKHAAPLIPHAKHVAFKPTASVLLCAMLLSTQAFGATSNVDVYGSFSISVSFDTAATLAESAATTAQAGLGLANLALFGAHHRSLLDSGLARSANGTCTWVTADFSSHNSADYKSGLAEAGVCKDIGSTRVGVGIGQAGSRQDRVLGGKTTYDGQYLIAEAAHDFGNSIEGSITGFYGRFDTKLRRNYLNGPSVDSSSATPDAESTALRLRLDWKDVAKLGTFSLSPFAAYTWSETTLDAYTETGGSLPLQFDASTWRVSNVRVGAAATRSLSATTDLRLSLTAAHQFESNIEGASGPSFNLPGQFPQQTRAIATVDVDHRLSNTTALSFGALTSGTDDSDSWGWGVTAGLRTNF